MDAGKRHAIRRTGGEEMSASIERYKIEDEQQWRQWIDEIPAIRFDSEWNVKVIPPFGGALSRFMIEHNGNHASVYLDAFDSLGYYGAPYWELYPYDGDTFRCPMADTDALLAALHETLAVKP